MEKHKYILMNKCVHKLSDILKMAPFRGVVSLKFLLTLFHTTLETKSLNNTSCSSLVSENSAHPGSRTRVL